MKPIKRIADFPIPDLLDPDLSESDLLAPKRRAAA